ncbi:MAG TPA: hypothetical protein VIJ37_00565 [Steroidobacteraceae bacterium]
MDAPPEPIGSTISTKASRPRRERITPPQQDAENRSGTHDQQVLRLKIPQDAARRGTERPSDTDLPPALRHPVAGQAHDTKGRDAEQDRADDRHEQRFTARSAIKDAPRVGKRLHAHDSAPAAVFVQPDARSPHGSRELPGLGAHQIVEIRIGPQQWRKHREIPTSAGPGKLTLPESVNDADDRRRRIARPERGHPAEHVAIGLEHSRQISRDDHAAPACVIVVQAMSDLNVVGAEIASRNQLQPQRIQCVIIDQKHRRQCPRSRPVGVNRDVLSHAPPTERLTGREGCIRNFRQGPQTGQVGLLARRQIIGPSDPLIDYHEYAGFIRDAARRAASRRLLLDDKQRIARHRERQGDLQCDQRCADLVATQGGENRPELHNESPAPIAF